MVAHQCITREVNLARLERWFMETLCMSTFNIVEESIGSNGEFLIVENKIQRFYISSGFSQHGVNESTCWQYLIEALDPIQQ